MSATTACVYVLRAKNRYKIGVSSNVGNRIAQLQTGCPEKIEVHLEFDTARPNAVERWLHKRYDAVRTSGEWFALKSSHIKELEIVADTCGIDNFIAFVTKYREAKPREFPEIAPMISGMLRIDEVGWKKFWEELDEATQTAF